jgi:C4-dicarboxylate-specific signal transduction histidine kinase
LQNSVIGEIYCNHIEIEQVLLNLINNSIDAVSRLDDKWIAIETVAESDKCCVSITDSGLGIASELQYRIFEPFLTTKTADRGTGLGLSIIVGILEEHDAQIDYLLNNGHTCFKLSFNKA